MATTYTIGSCLTGDIAGKLGNQQVVVASCFFITIALWLAGGLGTDSLVSTWFGLGLCGLFTAATNSQTVPEIIYSIELSMDRKPSQMPDDHPDKAESDPLI